MAHVIARPQFRNELYSILNSRGHCQVLAACLGRSYGDPILNTSGALVEMTQLDRVISYAALRFIVPHGWWRQRREPR